MSAVITLLVADDQDIVRDGLVTVLRLVADFHVVGEAANGREAIAQAALLQPDVVLMDLRMPAVDGVAATSSILAARPGVAILVLTTYADDESIVGALRAGARGYLTKDAGRAELASAIRAVASGQTTLASSVGARLVEGWAAPAPAAGENLVERFPALTAREAEVLALIAEGLSNPEIAGRLYVGTATVKTHINSIFAKLGTSTRAQTIALVRR